MIVWLKTSIYFIQDKRLLGMIKHGIYKDDCEGLNLDTIEESYGTAGEPITRLPEQTGAGSLDDGDIPMFDLTNFQDNPENDLDNFDQLNSHIESISDDNSNEFLPAPVKPPRHACPFSEDEMQLFRDSLEAAVQADIVPHGYGILPEEWSDKHYPTVEIIRTGRKGGKRAFGPIT
ncbi:hypothetical protein K435DRAFT_866076 [Dendrothele bispora CBS 962.96]|uniref:Uncharacterized protein n=1 Tax=Dendrothele bispora (strain CBS 962.96) TaxID=1314807 RepID=A0A4S8LHZ8_DENBC|nr:hypothetical protein K435DRAFT_866076 [Dendrothele bispora CBS 962.96]